MKTSLKQSSFMCTINDRDMNNILIVVFMLSFLLFKFIFNKKNISPEEEQRKDKKVKKYLSKYQKENEDFFTEN